MIIKKKLKLIYASTQAYKIKIFFKIIINILFIRLHINI